MALTELQLPDKTSFYREVQSVAGEIVSRMLRWQEVAEFIQTMESGDLTAMGITDSDVIADLTAFRTAIGQLVDVFNGGSVTPTTSPSDVMDDVRRMIVL